MPTTMPIPQGIVNRKMIPSTIKARAIPIMLRAFPAARRRN
jgi:hypothetical protein